MPRRRKNGQSPARQTAGPPEGGSISHNEDYPPLSRRYPGMANNFQTSSVDKERIVKSMQEMFSHLDPDVIHIVLSECDFKVENAMDSLLELSRAAEIVTPNSPPVSAFECTAAALLSPHHFSEPQQPSAPLPSTNLLTDELDLLIDQEFETLAAQQDMKEEQQGSMPLCTEVPLFSFCPPPASQQTLPELLQSSLEAGSRDQVTNQPSVSGGLARPFSGASSPLDQLSTWEDRIPEAQKDVLDFTHLMTSPDMSTPPLDLAVSGRPSAFQVYKKQDQSYTLPDGTQPKDLNSLVGGTKSKMHSDPLSHVLSPWNSVTPMVSPHVHGNQRPTFITPVAQTPSVWFSHTRDASPWLNQVPVSQAPLKPATAIPQSWVPLAPPQAPTHPSRLHLQGKLLVLLRGAPGSGKSTLARALLEHNPGGVILSTDDYFYYNGRYQFDPTVLGEAHEWNHKRAKEAFERGANPIIIDNTNLQGWEMKPYVVQAQKHGYKVLFREPDTWWKHKPRELERRSKHGVPVETIRRMLNGYERFVSVQSIIGSNVPEFKQHPLQEIRSASSDRPGPDLVGHPGLIGKLRKPHLQLFSSLPDVSSIGRCAGEVDLQEGATCKSTESLNFQLSEHPTIKPNGSDADDDTDLGELNSQLNSQLEPNHSGGDQSIPDCIVESVMNDDHCGDETDVAFSESIGQRVRRERAGRRSDLETKELVDLVKDTDQLDKENSKGEAAEGGEMVRSDEEEEPRVFNFVGDWPIEGTLKQRQVRKRERRRVMPVKEDIKSVQSGPDVTAFQKLLDLIQTGVFPVEMSSSRSQSLSLSSGVESQEEDEAGDRRSNKGELPDCVQDWKATDSCNNKDLRADVWERVKTDNERSSITEGNTNVSEISRESVDFKSSDPTEELSIKDQASTDVLLKDSTENIRGAGTEAYGSHTSSVSESPACEVFSETENSQEKKPRQVRRSGKQCKLALTFTQNCPMSLSKDSVCPDTTAELIGDKNKVNLDAEPKLNPDLDTSLDPIPNSDLHSESTSEGLSEPQAPLALVETGCFTQTEPQDFAILWRLNRHNTSDHSAVAASRHSSDITVMEGNSSRFVPQPCTVSAVVADQVPYRVVLEKGSQVEEKELEVTLDKLENLRILSRHFKLVSFDTLEDLYDKCQQDLEWTTNLLLDSGERFFREEDGEEEIHGAAAVEDFKKSSLRGVGCEISESVKHSDTSKAKQAGTEEEVQQSACGTSNESNEGTKDTEALSGSLSVPVRNNEPSDSSSYVEKYPQTEHLPIAEKYLQQTVNSDHKAEPEPGLDEGGVWGLGSLENEETIYESRHDIQDEIASMDEINRLLQAELEEIEMEEETRKPKRSSRHLDIETVELKLPTELALQLTELFGPVGVDLDKCSADDFTVLMNLNLAKLLHTKWKKTVQERQRQAMLSFHLLQESSVSGRDSQVTTYGPQDPSQADNFFTSQGGDMSLVSQPEACGQMPFMDHWNVSRPHVSLRDVIKEQQALQENMQKTRQSRSDLHCRDGATLLKEKQLYSMFPTIDKHFLQDIFRDHNYSLTLTKLFLRSLLNEEPVKTVVAPEAPRSDHHRTPSKDREKKQKAQELAVPDYQDMEDPEYEDFRAEANLQRKRQLESFSKAAEAHSQGRKEVASFYAQQGHLHGQRMREANHRAAAQIFERVNSSLLPRNILDLHGLHVNEALEHLAQVLHAKTADFEQGLCLPQLSVITGRGNHSQGGVARIRPAVIDYLTRKHYRFTEPNQGVLSVSLK